MKNISTFVRKEKVHYVYKRKYTCGFYKIKKEKTSINKIKVLCYKFIMDLYFKTKILSEHEQMTYKNWRKWKVKGDLRKLYKYVMSVNYCEKCNVKLCGGSKMNNRRCMDHDHETGEFRNVLCNLCNVRRK